MSTLLELAVLVFLVFFGLGLIIGGPKFSSKVLAGPLSVFGWILRGLIGAAGRAVQALIAALWRAAVRVAADIWRAFVRVVRDAHEYCYARWPAQTILIELGGPILIWVLIIIVWGIIGIFQRWFP